MATTLISYLATYGTKVIFGYPGAVILSIMDELYNHPSISFYVPRTEQGGSFMAEGYAKAGRKIGIILTSSGPGAINILTSISNACRDGTPLLALTGQVSIEQLGTQSFQEIDIIHMSSLCTKWNKMITSTDQLLESLHLAIYHACNRCPGPVLLSLPSSVMSCPSEKITSIHSYNEIDTEPAIDPGQLIYFLQYAKRPLFIVGQGVLHDGIEAIHLLRKLSLHYLIPVTSTLLGMGIMDETHFLSLKMMGMYGTLASNQAILTSDVIVAFGCRLDERAIRSIPSTTIFIHINYEESSRCKTKWFIKSSCLDILRLLPLDEPRPHTQWLEQIQEWKIPMHVKSDILQGRDVLIELNRLMYTTFSSQKFIIVSDVGSHQMWTAQYIEYNHDRIRFMTSGGMGVMGYALPASIGASIACPDWTVICICGDAGFFMSMTEIYTAVTYSIPIKLIVINNQCQLMIKHQQTKQYQQRYIGIDTPSYSIDTLIQNMGCTCLRCDSKDQVNTTLQTLLCDTNICAVNYLTSSDEPCDITW